MPFVMSICDIHRSSVSAFLTEEPFFFEISKIFGAMSIGLRPSSQGDVQKQALAPLPTTTFVAAAKRSLSASVQGVPSSNHGFGGSAHAFQSLLKRRAAANLSKFRMPRPPKALGPQTHSQLILHLAPVTLSQPAQRNARRKASIRFITSAGKTSEVIL